MGAFGPHSILPSFLLETESLGLPITVLSHIHHDPQPRAQPQQAGKSQACRKATMKEEEPPKQEGQKCAQNPGSLS